jgi:hypothetical protein
MKFKVILNCKKDDLTYTAPSCNLRKMNIQESGPALTVRCARAARKAGAKLAGPRANHAESFPCRNR